MIKHLLVSSFLTLLVVSGFANAESTSEPIKIGALMPLTGEFAMYAAGFREGIELAEETINKNGGINGRPIKVIIEDTQSNPRLINAAAEKLINTDHVVAAVTTSYPETAVGGAQFQRAHIPSLAMWDSSPQIDDMGDYVFAIGPWTPSDADVVSRFSINRLKAKTVVIVNTVEHWSELVGDLFEKEFTGRGGTVIARYKQNPGDTDFRTIISKIKSEDPEVIYAPLASEVVPFHQQLKASGYSKSVISTGVISDEHIETAPSVFEGVYQSQISDPKRPETQQLAKLYRAKFRKDMTLTWYVSTGNDAIQLYAHALRSVGPTSFKIKDFLYTVKAFPGAAQIISISPGGSSPYFVNMFRIEDGQFKEVPDCCN